jgi:hypothetical protein
LSSTLEHLLSADHRQCACFLVLQSTLYIGNVDADEGFLVVRNGSIDPISLRGWILKSFRTKEELKLPDISLQPSTLGCFRHPAACSSCA